MPAFALFFKAGLAASKGEARRLIRGGGARVDDVVVADEAQVIGAQGTIKLSAGKKQHVIATISM
jgi:tyrosyl-tRNA synthetase